MSALLCLFSKITSVLESINICVPLGEKVTPSDYFEASKCPKSILSTNMFKTSDQTAGLNLKVHNIIHVCACVCMCAQCSVVVEMPHYCSIFSKGNQDVGQSTPDLFFNLAVGGATASSTPRFVGTAGSP